MKGFSLHIYWAVTIPVTILTLGLWLAWTMYRTRTYRERRLFSGIDPIVRRRRGGSVPTCVEGQEGAISLDALA